MLTSELAYYGKDLQSIRCDEAWAKDSHGQSVSVMLSHTLYLCNPCEQILYFIATHEKLSGVLGDEQLLYVCKMSGQISAEQSLNIWKMTWLKIWNIYNMDVENVRLRKE
jgi:hypothetical protein